MDWERYHLYVDLVHQVRAMEEAALRRGSRKQEREGNVRAKSKRAGGGRVVHEPKLDRKKHRRTSRKASKQRDMRDYQGLDDVAQRSDLE